MFFALAGRVPPFPYSDITHSIVCVARPAVAMPHTDSYARLPLWGIAPLVPWRDQTAAATAAATPSDVSDAQPPGSEHPDGRATLQWPHSRQELSERPQQAAAEAATGDSCSVESGEASDGEQWQGGERRGHSERARRLNLAQNSRRRALRALPSTRTSPPRMSPMTFEFHRQSCARARSCSGLLAARPRPDRSLTWPEKLLTSSLSASDHWLSSHFGVVTLSQGPRVVGLCEGGKE